MAGWLSRRFGVEARAVRELGLRDAADDAIYGAARNAAAVVMTKDEDFAILQQRLGPPPQLIWITCGNTTNAHLRQILEEQFETARQLLAQGEMLVEIAG